MAAEADPPMQYTGLPNPISAHQFFQELYSQGHPAMQSQYFPSQLPFAPYPPSQYPPPQRPPPNSPPQYVNPHPPSQYLSPTVQCPCCATQFAPFTIQYKPTLTTWSTSYSNPIAAPAIPPNITPQQYAPSAAQQPAPRPTQTIDFGKYMNVVRKVYDKYSSSSSSKEYDNASDAIEEIEAIVKMIKNQASKASFAGKQDAMDTIVEIASEVLEESGSTLDSEIRKSFDWSAVGGAIESILGHLSPAEIEVLQQDGELAMELRQLAEGAREYALEPDLEESIAKLSKPSDGGDEAGERPSGRASNEEDGGN